METRGGRGGSATMFVVDEERGVEGVRARVRGGHMDFLSSGIFFECRVCRSLFGSCVMYVLLYR